MTDFPLLDRMMEPAPGFGGKTFDQELDGKRLGRQMQSVYDHMTRAPGWWTLRELEDALHHPQASISARLRDLRKMGLDLQRRRRGNEAKGIHEYKIAAGEPSARKESQ